MTYGKTYRGEELRKIREISYGLTGLAPVIEDDEAKALVWYPPRKGSKFPLAIAFGGNRKRPDFYLRFRSAEERREKVQNWLKGMRERAADKAKERAEAKAEAAKGHPLEVGSILYCSWGYDQTNIDFYEVTEKPSKCYVIVRRIAAEMISEGGPSEQVVAVPGAYLDNYEPMRKRPDSKGRIAVYSFASASPWDGKPKTRTGAYWGH